MWVKNPLCSTTAEDGAVKLLNLVLPAPQGGVTQRREKVFGKLGGDLGGFPCAHGNGGDSLAPRAP